MARNRKKKAIPPWSSATLDGHEIFPQIGLSLLQSPQFAKLSAGSRITYLCMVAECKGKSEFEFPKRVAERYNISKTSFDRHKKELIQAGFINAQSGKNLRVANKYGFCYDWKGK